MNRSLWLLCLFVLLAMYASVKAKKLTASAAITGGVLCIFIYLGAQLPGIAMLAAFFILGTIATMWQIKQKENFSIAEENKGRRKASQVIANAGVAAIAGLLIYIFPTYTSVLQVTMAASFSSATADTLSSELGNVFGKKFYNIITFKKDNRGLDGVISLEGTLAGVAGSIVIALIYIISFGWNIRLFLIIIIAGTIGNLTDSIMGATLERKQYLPNDVVNFLNTLIAALAAFLCF